MSKQNKPQDDVKPQQEPEQPPQQEQKVLKREVQCGFCRNTVIFEGVKAGQKIACPKCNATLEIKK